MSSGVQRFARDVGLSFASLSISAGAHFLLRLFIARYLGSNDLGLYTLVFTFYSFGVILSAFGIGAALIKYVAQQREDTSQTSLLISVGGVVSFFFGCTMGLLLYTCSTPIANSFFDMPELENLLRILSIAYPFIALEKSTLGFLQGLRRMHLFAFINIAQNIMTLILTVLLVLSGYGLSGAVWALVIPLVLMSLFSLFSIRKHLARPDITKYRPVTKFLLAFGLYVVLVNGIGMIQTQTDSTMIGYFMTDIDVGIYAVAIVLRQALLLPSQSIQMITNPQIATFWGRGETDKIEDLINRAMKFTAALIVPIALIVAFLSHNLISLIFGDDYSSADLPLQILIIGVAFYSISVSVGTTLSSTAYINIIFRLSAGMVVLNIILNLLLIPRMGIEGAAIATSISETIAALLHFYFIQRLVGIRIHWQWFFKFFIFVGALTVATYGLGIITTYYIWLPAAIIMFAIILLKYFITREDLDILKKAILAGKSSS